MKHTIIQTKHGLLIIITIMLLFGVAIYLVVNTNKTYDSKTNAKINTTGLKTYSSKSMKFSIEPPQKFQMDEKFFRVTLTSNEGNIYIEKGNTNFENIDDYVNDLDVRNNSITTDKKKISINNMQSIRGFVGKEKYYFIYANGGTIFTLFADSSQLFPDLDQIAQSFRYTP